MNTRIYLLTIMSFFVSAVAAQNIENDDMYFNSEDRAKVFAAREASASSRVSEQIEEEEQREDVNPTDSYSGRNVNPEYISRSQNEIAEEDEENYYVDDYRLNNQRNFNSWNSQYNNWYNNPWYSSAYYAPSIHGWNSPYYGSRYDPWGSPWNNPYYRSGWSSSFSYYWGNSWDYGWGSNFGWGMSYGWGNNWGWRNPWRSAWGYPGYFDPYYGHGYGYPTRVVVVENNRRQPVYGKRGSRSSSISRDYDNSGRNYQPNTVRGNRRSSTTVINSAGSNNSNAAQETRSQQRERAWKNESRSRWSSESENNGRATSTWSQPSNNNSSWGNSSNNSSRSTYTPSRSSSSSGSSGRSSSGSSGGSRSSRGRGGN